MSETDSTVVPPPNEFVREDGGLTRWRAELDGISVRRVINGVRVEIFSGSQSLALTLSHDEAGHLAGLLAQRSA